MKAGIIIVMILVRYDIPYEILVFYLGKFRKLIVFYHLAYVVNMCHLNSLTWSGIQKDSQVICRYYLHRCESVLVIILLNTFKI